METTPKAEGQTAGSATSSSKAASIDSQSVEVDAPPLKIDRRNREAMVRARHQGFGFALFGSLALVAAVVLTQWDTSDSVGRWFWVLVGPPAGALCLVQSKIKFGGIGADRDPSPYFGMLGGIVVGTFLLAVYSVDGWVLTGVYFALAVALAFMAWIEQSTIGMTAALIMAMITAMSGVAGLTASVGPASLALGLMLLAAAFVLSTAEPADSPSPAEN